MGDRCEISGDLAEPYSRQIKKFVTACIPDLFRLDMGVVVSVALVDDEEIQRLNRDFRKLDTPTDVLSFEDRYQQPDGTMFVGDIIVSVPFANRDKDERNLLDYILFLVAHGLLHLTGLDHKTDDERLEMISMGEDLLRLHGK